MKQFETDMINLLNFKKKISKHKPNSEEIENIRILIELLLKFGIDIQLVIAIEEMSELTKEITKLIRKIYFEKSDTDYTDIKLRIAEEIADIEICIQQLRLLLNSHEISHLNLYKEQKFSKIKKLIVEMVQHDITDSR